MTHGSTDGATHGIMAAIGEDGMIRSTTGDSGDGTAHGIIPDIGVIHGIRTMPDGTAASVRTTTDTSTAARASDTEDISQARCGMVHAMRHRGTSACSPTAEKLQ